MSLPQSLAEKVDRIHGAGIVDVVSRDERGVHRPRWVGMDELVDEILHVRRPREDAIHPQILSAHRRIQVGIFGMRRVGRRMGRARTDMTEAARHTDTIRPDELRVSVIFVIVVIALRIPARLGGLVKFRVGKEPQTKDAGRLAEIGANGQRGPVLERLAAFANLHARIIRCILERVGVAQPALRWSSQRPKCAGSGALGSSKHGSLTAPSHFQRESHGHNAGRRNRFGLGAR